MLGLIKWFDLKKGFGVAVTADNAEYFLRAEDCNFSRDVVKNGLAIVFRQGRDQGNGRLRASNCREVQFPRDFGIIMQTLLKDDNIDIEIGRRKIPVSLKKAAAILLFQKLPATELIHCITDYFDKALDESAFIEFCEFTEENIKIALPSAIQLETLDAIFSHFGRHINTNILFLVWKRQKFRYLHYSDDKDYEIPVDLLYKFIDEINIGELQRIINYSYGKQFCRAYAQKRLGQREKSVACVQQCFGLLPFLREPENTALHAQLVDWAKSVYAEEFNTEAGKLGIISNEKDLSVYEKFISSLLFKLPAALFDEFNQLLIDGIVVNTAPSYRYALWQKGLVHNLAQDDLVNGFDTLVSLKDKIKLLKKCDDGQRLYLLKEIVHKSGLPAAYGLLIEYLKDSDERPNLHDLVIYFEMGFEGDRPEILNLFDRYTDLIIFHEDKLRLFLAGLKKDFPDDQALSAAAILKKDECLKILDARQSDKNFAFSFIAIKLKTVEKNLYGWLSDVARKYLTAENFIAYQKSLLKQIGLTNYIDLWENEKVDISWEAEFEFFLSDEIKQYEQVKGWVVDGRLDKDSVKQKLIAYLEMNEQVTDRVLFYKQFNHIQLLLHLDPGSQNTIERINSNFYTTVLWFLGKTSNFLFEEFSKKFIYFNPDDQVKGLRKIFYAKATGEINFTAQDLQKLTRVDINLYNTVQQYAPGVKVDISSDTVINALCRFQETGKFLLETELISLVLKNIGDDKTKRFRLAHYFEDCNGRMEAKWDWNTAGAISKIPHNNSFYFAIRINPPIHPGEYQSFNALVEAVKNLPGRRWNAEEQFWGVPGIYEQQVLSFAKSQKMLLNFGGPKYEQNLHLSTFFRGAQPAGVHFCEGKEAGHPDRLHNKIFWWCAGKPCFEHCETKHTPADGCNSKCRNRINE